MFIYDHKLISRMKSYLYMMMVDFPGPLSGRGGVEKGGAIIRGEIDPEGGEPLLIIRHQEQADIHTLHDVIR